MLMKQKKVWITSGAPGSGKSTFVKSLLKENDVWISRDNIRFSLLGPKDDYFSKENEVIEKFYNEINESLENPNVKNIYIDATHLNASARNKTINAIKSRKNIKEINCIYFNIPIMECLKRNSMRKGLAFVPIPVVRKMHASCSLPTKKEGFDHVYQVDKDNNMKEVNVV